MQAGSLGQMCVSCCCLMGVGWVSSKGSFRVSPCPSSDPATFLRDVTQWSSTAAGPLGPSAEKCCHWQQGGTATAEEQRCSELMPFWTAGKSRLFLSALKSWVPPGPQSHRCNPCSRQSCFRRLRVFGWGIGEFEQLKFDPGSVVHPAVLEAGSAQSSVHESWPLFSLGKLKSKASKGPLSVWQIILGDRSALALRQVCSWTSSPVWELHLKFPLLSNCLVLGLETKMV